MKSWAFRHRSFFYLIATAFAVMAFVEWPLLVSAYKGKEKDFNDKLFQVAPFVEDGLSKDSNTVRSFNSDEDAIRFVQSEVIPLVDTFFSRNSIPVKYVFAVGKLSATSDYYAGRSRFRTPANLIWSSDASQNSGLADTRLTITHIGPKNADLYFVKVFLPGKPAFLFKQLLPLVAISAIAILILFVSFLILASIIRKQSALALAKENFINNMTHELKTPLFTISIASKMLSEQAPIRENEKYIAYIDSIQTETARLRKLVEKVLETSALEKKQLQLDCAPVDLHALIKAAVNSVELIRQEQQAAITLRLRATEHLISGDETHLMAAICSLLDNALKYSDGPARITISSANEGRDILISIADEGVGIDIEARNQLFEPFFRANTGNLHNVKGYGIGLSYVKSIIDGHHGKISVNSTPGKGSEFILRIPFINGQAHEHTAG
jgi:signal transduction histidine kinase